MKFTLSWLKDHLETTATRVEISEKLTAIGLEVEALHNPGESLAPFIVAEILEAVPHPDADKLRVCTVNNGTETLQIVCGAPNARAGIRVALASVGTVIPTNDLQIKASKIRGVDSNGMLCSARELGLGDDHNGIMELPLDTPLGIPITGPLGLDDVVIDINLTPNRPDCLGVRGIARDLAAAGLGTLKPLPETHWQPQGESAIRVGLEDADCPHFIGCHIRAVKNAPSPAWLQQRLKAIGLRPISALVDITNYFSLNYARPLHVFDAAKLSGTLTVRPSRESESFAALNDKSYSPEAGTLALADASGLLGLAGVIGGSSTGCELETTEAFLEVAYFTPARIAATGRALQVDSDARYRFERGVDPAFVEQGATLAVQMILDLCGGTASPLVVAGQPIHWQRQIPFSAEAVNKIAGTSFSAAEQQAILQKLGFEVSEASVTPPSWRADVFGTPDLAEEVLRIKGYDCLSNEPLPKLPGIETNLQSLNQQRHSAALRTLAARGLHEVQSWSFMARPLAEQFGFNNEALALVNPISRDLDVMRPSILPNLLQAAARNQARGARSQSLFEIGLQWSAIGEQGQHRMATILRSGKASEKSPLSDERAYDAHDAKADAQSVIDACEFDSAQLQYSPSAPAWYHPGRSGSLMMGKNRVASFGELHPALLLSLDAPARTVGCEVFLDAIPFPRRKVSARAPYSPSDYQAVTRDYAFIVPEKMPANNLLRAVNAGDKKLIQAVTLFDVYQGKGVQEGHKSLAVTVTLQAPDRTLSEQDIAQANTGILQQAEKIGAKLRS